MYASGWIKRGPVGLIGSTKSDSKETVRQLLDDVADLDLSATVGDDPLETVLATSPTQHIGWEGWLRVDAHEKRTGTEQGRDRIKVYSREELIALALGQAVPV